MIDQRREVIETQRARDAWQVRSGAPMTTPKSYADLLASIVLVGLVMLVAALVTKLVDRAHGAELVRVSSNLRRPPATASTTATPPDSSGASWSLQISKALEYSRTSLAVAASTSQGVRR
ncbi:MAG TPA: hypothetical protein VN808_17435 [Stellaceae bacterium]|nr:hypothetical protein [Stellaceae bacterium]